MHGKTDLVTMEIGEEVLYETAEAQFNVLVAYDNVANARRAMLLVDGLAGRIGPGVELHRELLRFDIMALLGTRVSARHGVAAANLVVVAADADRDLPVEVKHWLESWAIQHVPCGAALVALSEKEDQHVARGSPVQGFLRTLTAEVRIDFFAH